VAGAAVGWLIGLNRPLPPAYCTSGSLTIEGSTAFAPTVTQVKDSYDKDCHDVAIKVLPSGSLTGLRTLDTAIKQSDRDRFSRVAMSDGPAPPEFKDMDPHSIGIVIFTVVVNKDTGIHDLSLEQLRAIHQGHHSNWKELNGADLPIRIVSRGSESGTRRAFEARVLGLPEEPLSSDDCITKNRNPGSSVVRCELSTTPAQLQEVNTVPGAIGYAEASAAATYGNINLVQLNGSAPDIHQVRTQRIPIGPWSTSIPTVRRGSLL
jgi:phosphate transport system substrate-binding protein